MRRRRGGQGGSIAVKIITCLLAVLVIVYLAGAFYFISHFMPNTTINDMDVSGMTEEQAEKLLTDEVRKYKLSVIGREDTGGSIAAEDIGLKPVFNGLIGEFLDDENPLTWPLSLFKKAGFASENVVDFDRNELQAALSALGLFSDGRAPKDAYLSEYSPETGYSVVAEDPGTALIREKTEAAAENAVESLTRELDLEKEGCYLAPEVFLDDATLNELKDNLNRFVCVKLTIDYGDTSEVIDGELIGQWLTVDGTNVTMDESKVKEYVDYLAKTHDTFGIAREITTANGEKITVRGGNYGWWTDRPNTTAALTETIYKGESGEFTPVYFSEAVVHGESDIGDNYVEIDLDDQHVYVYKEGRCVVQSDCVSGKVSNGNFTPDGTYAITYKERDAELVGENYTSPVSYWMPFNGNIGMHDATWRNKFGGDIYLTGGSHGCVNLPKAKAAEIFDNVEKGEAVIVYGGKQSAPAEISPDQMDVTNLTEEQQQALLQLILQQQADAMDGQINEGGGQ